MMSKTRSANKRPLTYQEVWGRIGVYAFLGALALFFLLPLYVMLVTSFKSMIEIRLGLIFLTAAAAPASMPSRPGRRLAPDSSAPASGWPGNSVMILVPSVIFSILLGASNALALSFWKVKGANVLFACLLLGLFVPYQVHLSAGALLCPDRHLRLAARHRAHAHHLRHAGDDAVVPQLLLGSSGRVV